MRWKNEALEQVQEFSNEAWIYEMLSQYRAERRLSQTWILVRKIPSSKMIILEKYKWLQKSLGLDPLGGIENILVRILYLVTLISFNSTELIFIILNIRDGIEQAAPALAPIGALVSVMISYGYLLINRKVYYFLLHELQEIVNESA